MYYPNRYVFDAAPEYFLRDVEWYLDDGLWYDELSFVDDCWADGLSARETAIELHHAWS